MFGITVCITTYKRPALLEECLRSIFRNDTRPVEIIISDNDFSEESARAGRNCPPPPGMTVRHFANPGPKTPSENVRAALRAASHERLLMIHDDDYMLPGGVDALASAWDAHGDDVDAVYGRQKLVFSNGDPDDDLTRNYDRLFRKNAEFGPQRSNLWAALIQQFPNTGMMFRKSIFERVGYPSESEVGRGPLDFHFAIRYALASNRPFVLVEEFVSACRQTDGSILRNRSGTRVFDGHLGFECLERVPVESDEERSAKRKAMGVMAPLAIAGYLMERQSGKAFRVWCGNLGQMEKGILEKAAMLMLIVMEFLGLGIMRTHGGRINYLYYNVLKRG